MSDFASSAQVSNPCSASAQSCIFETLLYKLVRHKRTYWTAVYLVTIGESSENINYEK